MSLNEKIVLLRKNNNLSQEEFAHRIIVNRKTVSRWETGEALPSIDNLIQIAQVFNVSIDELVENDEELKRK